MSIITDKNDKLNELSRLSLDGTILKIDNTISIMNNNPTSADNTTYKLDILGDGSCIAAYPLFNNTLDLGGKYSLTLNSGGFVNGGKFGVGCWDSLGTIEGGEFDDTLATELNDKSNISVSYWVYIKEDNNGEHQTPLMCIASSSDESAIQYSQKDEKLWGEWNSQDGTGNLPEYSISKSDFYGKWNNIVLTFDGEYIRYYLNGTKVAEAEQTSNTKIERTRLGRSDGDDNESLNGSMCMIRFFNKGLSEEEVNKLFTEVY